MDKNFIKANTWLYYPLYGLKASQDIAGRDATDEVTTIVLLRAQRSTLLTVDRLHSAKTLQLMTRYQFGTIDVVVGRISFRPFKVAIS